MLVGGHGPLRRSVSEVHKYIGAAFCAQSRNGASDAGLTTNR
jgi:hypothetical protein